MSLVVDFANQVFWLFKESAVYMILGIMVAGFLRYAISEKHFVRFFGGDNFRSTLVASLFGIPLPLCSCSVLPMMISMRERGASKGATTSFLISTPETGVDSISITYALLDPIFTVTRPLAALISALATGSVVNLFVRRGWDTNGEDSRGGKDSKDGENGDIRKKSDSPTAGEEGGGCTSCCAASKPLKPEEEEGSLLRRGVRYGFGPLLDSLTPLLIMAFAVSGLIAMLVPDGFFQNPVTQGWSGMLIMLVVGIPFYVCATSSTPLVAILLMKGLSPGAALVFLLAGPVTNMGTILAVMRYLGFRIMMVYVFCTAGLTLLMGGIVDSIYRDLNIPVEAIVGQAEHFMPESLKVIAVVVLLGLMAGSAWRIGLLKRWRDKLRRWAEPLGIDPSGRRALTLYALILVLLYGASAFSVVNVGEVGWILTFGEVERDAQGRVVTLDDPGLHLHGPWPFQVLKTGRPDEIRLLDFGYRPAEGEDAGLPFGAGLLAEMDTALEAQVMTGEESLVSLKFSVQYRLADPYAYYFGFDDPEEVVRGYSAAAVRTACARRSTQDILVGYRAEIEGESRSRLQDELDALGAGVSVLRIAILDLHAPAQVHYAFRDVASASEDKHQQELNGESAYHETLAEARGRAFRIEQEAESKRHFKVNEAEGKAKAFAARSQAFQSWEDLTRIRLFLETMEHVLSAAKTVYTLAEEIDVEVWLRSTEGGEPPFLDHEETEKGPEGDPRTGEGGFPLPADQKRDRQKEPDWIRALRNR